jgi:hypothetical protein
MTKSVVPAPLPTISPDAVSVWKEGSALAVVMDGHKVLIPLQPWEWLGSARACPNSEHALASCPTGGLRQLALLCKARESLNARTIGHDTSPTQWDIVNKTLISTAAAEERLARALAKRAKQAEDRAKHEAKVKALFQQSNEDILKSLGL